MKELEDLVRRLDDQIDAVQRDLDPKRPENDLPGFTEIRALSLSRTFIRRILSLPQPSWERIDEIYDTARKSIA